MLVVSQKLQSKSFLLALPQKADLLHVMFCFKPEGCSEASAAGDPRVDRLRGMPRSGRCLAVRETKSPVFFGRLKVFGYQEMGSCLVQKVNPCLSFLGSFLSTKLGML